MQKNIENIFYFWDNSILKCPYKLSALRREYILAADNRLTNTPKILRITQREFFNQNCLHKDQ